MKRREFIAVLGSAAAWPLAARAQQGERVRRVGVLMGLANDQNGQQVIAAFRAGLNAHGWTEARNLRIDYRWAEGKTDLIKAYTGELLNLKPEAVLISGARILTAMQDATRTVPLVFVGTVDPAAQGFVASWARPGGNTTGFTVFEISVLSKMLETLKQIAPSIKRLAVIFHSDNPESIISLRLLETAAPSFAIKPIPAPVRDRAEIERTIETLAHEPNTGLLLPPDIFLTSHRELIVQLATLHRLPAVYSSRAYPTGGGLVSYGFDDIDLFRRAAGYIDLILKGAKPADLPVQAPTKFELVINLKTAKALGLTIPPNLLAVADEVIE
jgi:putative tryptophan/tyrosine transport system substrate-binding protein